MKKNERHQNNTTFFTQITAVVLPNPGWNVAATFNGFDSYFWKYFFTQSQNFLKNFIKKLHEFFPPHEMHNLRWFLFCGGGAGSPAQVWKYSHICYFDFVSMIEPMRVVSSPFPLHPIQTGEHGWGELKPPAQEVKKILYVVPVSVSRWCAPVLSLCSQPPWPLPLGYGTNCVPSRAFLTCEYGSGLTSSEIKPTRPGRTRPPKPSNDINCKEANQTFNQSHQELCAMDLRFTTPFQIDQ